MPEMISVIIPTYNHAQALPGCLRSLEEQTYKPLQVIVVDDGSTDDTQEMLEPWREKVTIIRQENRGAPAARNAGLRVATGEYVIFCDADVLFAPHALETFYEALQRHPEAAFAYSAFRFGWKKFRGAPWSFPRLKERNYIHTTSLIRRADVLPFDEALRRFQDWDMWLRLGEAGKCGVLASAKSLFTVRIEGASRIGSFWLPSFVYAIPWQYSPWVPERMRKYFAARDVIRKKHAL